MAGARQLRYRALQHPGALCFLVLARNAVDPQKLESPAPDGAADSKLVPAEPAALHGPMLQAGRIATQVKSANRSRC